MSGPDHGPIDPGLHKLMNDVAVSLDHFFNDDLDNRKIGFFLSAFNFNEQRGRFNYISNADPLDVSATLRDILGRLETRLIDRTDQREQELTAVVEAVILYADARSAEAGTPGLPKPLDDGAKRALRDVVRVGLDAIDAFRARHPGGASPKDPT